MLRFLLATMILLGGRLQPAPAPTEPISLANVDRIEQLEQIGYGAIRQFKWLPENNQLAVITSAGVVRYDNDGVDVSEPVSTQWESGGSILDAHFLNGQTMLAVERADDTVFIHHLESDQILEIQDNPDNGFLVDETFSRDGTLFAFLRMLHYSHGEVWQTTLSIIDTQTGEQIQQWSGEDFAGVSRVEFMSDGRTLAVLNNGSIERWNVDTGEQSDLLGEGIYLFSLNADGTKLATFQPAGDYQFAVWDVATTELEIGITEEFANPHFVMAFSPNGDWIASMSHTMIQIWSARTGEKVVETPYIANDYRFLRLSFSPDGRYIAFSDQNDFVYLYDTETGDEVNVLEGFSHSLDAVALSPDGTLVAMSGNSNLVFIWDLQQMTTPQTITSSYYEISDLAFTVDGETLFMATLGNGIDVRSTVDWTNSVSNIEDEFGASDIIVSPNGNLLAIGSIGDYVLRETSTYEQVYRWILTEDEYTEAIVFSADSTQIAIIINEYVTHSSPQAVTLVVRDVQTGAILNSVEFPESAPTLTSIAYSPDRTLIVTGDEHGVITLWDTNSLRQIATLTGHFDSVDALAFSRDGSLIISGSRDNTIRLWDVESYTEVRALENHANGISDLAFSVDGMVLASASWDGTVRLWGVP